MKASSTLAVGRLLVWVAAGQHTVSTDNAIAAVSSGAPRLHIPPSSVPRSSFGEPQQILAGNFGRGRDEDCSSPPRRSRRQTHRAPPSGLGVKAVTGQRV